MTRVRMCRKPGCTYTIPYNQTNPYCSEHAKLYNQEPIGKRPRKQSYYNQYKRDKKANAFYQSKAWEHTAAESKARAYYTCAVCEHTYDKPGYLITDHITPLRVDKRRRLDRENLWVLCKACHYWKTQLENQIYTSQSLVDNLDVSHKWTRQKITAWILRRRKK